MKHKKHSAYHRAPSRFSENKAIKSKYKEEERFSFIKSKLIFKDKKILDIGCNTAFFIFEALDNGAKCAIGYEGSKESQIIISDYIIKCNEKNIKLRKKYFDFKNETLEYTFDITFLLNVVHHFGDDYGDINSDLTLAKQKMLENINFLANHSKYMVFQMGFNWQGDISKPIFKNGTKKEMINFIDTGIQGFWEIKEIGVAEVLNDNTQYKDIDEYNILRNDLIGEFRNRPIFILKSLIID